MRYARPKLAVVATVIWLGLGPPAAPAQEDHSHHGGAPPPVPAAAEPAPQTEAWSASEAELAAAFPDVSGTDMKAHMDDSMVHWRVLFDEFEWQDQDAGDALKWDVSAFVGRDFDRLWLRAEGERVDGETEENQVELLWGRAVHAWWDVVLGLRQDFEPGPSRTYAAVGLQGLTPYQFEFEATAYAGERGQTAARLQFEHHALITNRLIVMPRLELNAYGKDDEKNGIGSGFSSLSAGLRLRYELWRELAPYVGYEWSGLFGDTADFARAEGGKVREGRLVAGVRIWF